jgi:hypothetical protein
MFNWRSLLGPSIDGTFGRKVQRLASLAVLSSLVAASLFGFVWGLQIVLDLSVQQACDQVIPLFSKLVLPQLHTTSTTIHLTCPHLQLHGVHFVSRR